MMENKYEHITEMENIMVQQEKTIQKMEEILNELDNQQDDYERLNAYYYSDKREKDLEDEEKHLIPEDLHRGVLSEDEVYNLFLDSNDTALHMIETALRILKTK